MKKRLLIILLGLFTIPVCSLYAQTYAKPLTLPGADNPWLNSQLIEPAALANIMMANGAHQPVILNIGVVDDIKGATHIGPVGNNKNLAILKAKLSATPKNQMVVFYCGCCPFAKCPNIRPAFAELTKLGFTNIKLLNLPVNLKTNWIDKNYPVESK
ncbi:rhodanese-like domain-containing protein [Mucilaginibacter sp. 14171R-50]|uniref:rhodanese-like domain-containing protein n=1 Tax=Mucilaginibacter sp. 14171R-50 TaxID=2703789 RepID=UPI00138CEEDE|nr:rhodanese-like domain-containing protein [Mucilaginibacter sp. 14171R-50]QHS56301.1 rhodanese-like domain-containing protein [Mucilaginibacter sp. 14171R-50]